MSARCRGPEGPMTALPSAHTPPAPPEAGVRRGRGCAPPAVQGRRHSPTPEQLDFARSDSRSALCLARKALVEVSGTDPTEAVAECSARVVFSRSNGVGCRVRVMHRPAVGSARVPVPCHLSASTRRCRCGGEPGRHSAFSSSRSALYSCGWSRAAVSGDCVGPALRLPPRRCRAADAVPGCGVGRAGACVTSGIR